MRGSLAVLVALAFASDQAYAQADDPPRRIDNVSLALANAAIGGLTAGLWRTAAGKPFLPGFARGAAAGSAVFAGKRIIGEGTAAGWWIGRHLAALGSSEVANAAHGRPFLHSAAFPIGPVRVHVNRTARRKISPRLDLASAVAVAAISMKPGARLGWRETATSGAIVFMIRETSSAIGGSAAGVMSLSELTPDGDFPGLEPKRSVMSHEMVHAAQYDFSFAVWGDAIQSAIARRNAWGRRISAYVDLNLALPIQLGANGIISYENRPWEREAVSLARFSH